MRCNAVGSPEPFLIVYMIDRTPSRVFTLNYHVYIPVYEVREDHTAFCQHCGYPTTLQATTLLLCPECGRTDTFIASDLVRPLPSFGQLMLRMVVPCYICILPMILAFLYAPIAVPLSIALWGMVIIAWPLNYAIRLSRHSMPKNGRYKGAFMIFGIAIVANLIATTLPVAIAAVATVFY